MANKKQEQTMKEVNDFLSNISALYTKYTNKEIDMECFLNRLGDIRKVKEVRSFWRYEISDMDDNRTLNMIFRVAENIDNSDCSSRDFYISRDDFYPYSKKQIKESYIESEENEDQSLTEYIEDNYYSSFEEFLEDYLESDFSSKGVDTDTVLIFAEKMQIINSLKPTNEDLYIDFCDECIVDKNKIKSLLTDKSSWRLEQDNFKDNKDFNEFIEKIKKEELNLTTNKK